jgi:hypothetical protein
VCALLPLIGQHARLLAVQSPPSENKPAAMMEHA